MDIKIVFLNMKLLKDVHKTQPKDFIVIDKARKVWKHQRSVYGLMEAY